MIQIQRLKYLHGWRQINPKFCINTLHNLHVHPSGFQAFIFLLNSNRLVNDLISSGTRSHVFGPRNLNVSVPEYVVRTLSVLKSQFLRRLYVLFAAGKIKCIKSGERLFLTLYISIESFCKLRWCMQNELSTNVNTRYFT